MIYFLKKIPQQRAENSPSIYTGNASLFALQHWPWDLVP